MVLEIRFTFLSAVLLASTAMPAAAEPVFNRIASFPVNTNLPVTSDAKTVTSAANIAASADGMTLVYTDPDLDVLGLVDISDPADPRPAGIIELDGRPAALSMLGEKVLAAVNTSKTYEVPSGYLAVIDLQSRALDAECDLGGQPNATAVSPDGSIIAIAIENERDGDANGGALPQSPAGHVEIFQIKDGAPDCSSRIVADISGLAEIEGNDPEPESVDINAANEIAVTLQENNHIVVLNGGDGSVIGHFSAGSVDLANIDVEEEGALTFDGEQTARLREPDGVRWLDSDRLVTANEGDYNGGSRGFTIFSKSGEVLYESGPDFEHRVAMAGHYPEKRSGNRGIEPGGLEAAAFGDERFIFVLAKTASMIGVYRDAGGAPEFSQLLPTALAPESAVAIPGRNLLAVANQADLVEDNGPRSHVTIYSYEEGEAAYPMIVSKLDDNGRPIGFGALSGLTADPEKPGIFYAVNDSFYGMQPTIFTIDATGKPAQITSATRVRRGSANAQLLDLEGLVSDGKGGFWLASEGRLDRMIPHGLYHVNANGQITKQIAFPPELLAVEKRFGSEGVTMIGDTLWIAIQRQWQDDQEDTVKLVAYDTKTKEWGAVRYPTEKPEKGWVGLSEITLYNDHVYIIERDNQIGADARTKKLYRVALTELTPGKIGGELPLVTKTLAHDFIPDMQATGGYVVDKIEGFAVDVDGNGFAVTDNDGVDDSNGETLFFTVGKMPSPVN